jgi:hypothetical protein
VGPRLQRCSETQSAFVIILGLISNTGFGQNLKYHKVAFLLFFCTHILSCSQESLWYQLSTFSYFFFVCVTKVLNSGPHTGYAGALTAWVTLPALFYDGFSS